MVHGLAALFVAFAGVVVLIQMRRAKRRGPQVLWFPASMRPRVNRFYREHGSPEPYDDSGNRRPWWRDGRPQ
jgi:hypothetical protein